MSFKEASAYVGVKVVTWIHLAVQLIGDDFKQITEHSSETKTLYTTNKQRTFLGFYG